MLHQTTSLKPWLCIHTRSTFPNTCRHTCHNQNIFKFWMTRTSVSTAVWSFMQSPWTHASLLLIQCLKWHNMINQKNLSESTHTYFLFIYEWMCLHICMSQSSIFLSINTTFEFIWAWKYCYVLVTTYCESNFINSHSNSSFDISVKIYRIEVLKNEKFFT